MWLKSQLFKKRKMNIRKGEKKDMKAVLELIQELATFEKEPDAVDVTVADLHETDYSAEGIRADIMKKKVSSIDSSKFTIILKPTKEATFKNTVDILDEMEITGNKLYAIVDVQPQEEKAYEEKMKTPRGKN